MKTLLLSLTAMINSVAWAAPEVATAPASATPELVTQGLGETVLSLVLVLGLIFALAWAVKRFGMRLPMAAKGPVQILGGVSLGTRERAVLLSVEGQRVLVGVAPGNVRTLHVLPADSAEPPAFAEQLQQVREEEVRQ